MFSVTKNCGRCGNLVDFRFKYAGECGRRDHGEQAFDVNAMDVSSLVRRAAEKSRDVGSMVNGYAVAFCPRCSGPALLEFETRERYLPNIVANLNEEVGLMGGQDLVKVTAIYPAAKEPETDTTWPIELVRQFADAQRMLEQGMTPSIIIGTCRTVLDLATKRLVPDDPEKVLARRIDKLLAAGVITKPIADWAHTIRLDGNEAVHEGVGEAADAREYIAFLKMFLNMVFSLPERINQRRNSRS